jgi:hypothetical protein
MFKIREPQKEAFVAAFGALAAPCTTCLIVRMIEIKGLYEAGYDDRPKPVPKGTTKGASYRAGYLSEDDRGRIFINRTVDGAWQKDTQGIEITVVVDPPSVAIPPGTTIHWTFEDPDDPSNENPRMNRDARRILDPNDYVGRWSRGPSADDNDTAGKAHARPRLTQLEPRYPLSGNETPVDPLTRQSKVRLDTSDIAGDNFRVTATIIPVAPITTALPATTGIMTMWNRIDLEYVKMASAEELPVDQIGVHYALACAQIDVSERREVTGKSDRALMGPNDSLARKACDRYATKAQGEFTKEHEKGWFFVASARRLKPVKDSQTLYEGPATAHGDHILLPPGVVVTSPGAVFIYNPATSFWLLPPKPKNPDLCTHFDVIRSDTTSPPRAPGQGPGVAQRRLWLEAHDFHKIDDQDNAFLNATLKEYGFADGETLEVKVVSAGTSVAGTSPGGLTVKGRKFFAGRLVIFTDDCPPQFRLIALCHELCHAFDNAHKCGNWDWTADAERTSCCMNYVVSFILDDATPRAPIRWTQGQVSAELCARHLRGMREYHLQDNPALKWG